MIRNSRDVGSPTCRLEREYVTKQAQHVLSAFPWRKYVLDAVSEQHDSNTIVVPHRRHCQHRRQLTRKLALEAADCAEALRAGEVDGQHDCQLALLDVPFHERPPHARCDVPVDRADLVSRLVFTHLRELHPLTLEYTPVFTGEERVHQPAGAQLDELYLPQDLRRNSLTNCFTTSGGRMDDGGLCLFPLAAAEQRPSWLDGFVATRNRISSAAAPAKGAAPSDHGAGTVARMRVTIASLVTSSASAS